MITSYVKKVVKMNLQVVFHFISTLTFVFKFSVNLNNQQDYFYFEGANQSAHLSRSQKILTLHLSQAGNFSVFRETINQSTFTFSWIGFKINGKPMNLTKSGGDTSELKYNSLLFMSPILDEIEECSSNCSEQISQYNSVNYWYIVLIVLSIGVSLNLKEEAVNSLKKILTSGARFSKVPEPISTDV